ncbi:MAG: guanylate kinase, partial [Olegusella sp.]|nr:guanylate kinase [Olegusella sp.]
MKARPRLFVISGPAGVGKGTLVARVRAKRPDIDLTVSATTRSPRPGEVEGVSYHYLSEEEFARRVDAGQFLEWAFVHGHRYGTLRSEVERRIAEGRSVILEIDCQGAFNVRKAFPD